jgi:hypothetical protein
MRASRKKRACNCALDDEPLPRRTRFNATLRPMRASRHNRTSPIPPSPRSAPTS